MTSEYRRQAATTLGNAGRWANGPDGGPVMALIGVGQALLAIHDVLETSLLRTTADEIRSVKVRYAREGGGDADRDAVHGDE